MDKSNTIKIVAGGLVVAVAGMAGGAMLFPVEKEVPVPQPYPVAGPVEYVDVEVPGPVQWRTEEVVVEVDNGNLALVLETIWDADGDVEYLVEGLDDDELNLIVERIVFESESKSLAEEAVKAEWLGELHREDVGAIELHKEDMKGLKIDSDDTEFSVLDYDDKDAEVFVTATFRQGSERFEATFAVLVLDGEVDSVSVESVSLI